MFTRILVPLDGSRYAEAALPAAVELARRSHGEIRLVCVLEPIIDDPTFNPFDPANRAWAEGYLAKIVGQHPLEAAARISTSLRDGLAVEQIVAEATSWRADVIVMATHGRSGVSRTWMGSVTDRCIRSATCPVLAVRPTEEGGTRAIARDRIVVPLDGSPLAEEALPYGVGLARELGVPLVLLEAVLLPRVVDPQFASETMDRGSEASTYLKGHLKRLRSEGVDVTERVVSDRGAAHAILECADGDLVVMSTHGRTGVERVFFGSVADKVIRGATGAVLVIPSLGAAKPTRRRGKVVGT
jgi:nucleotide-binding universal stress UspA family protein